MIKADGNSSESVAAANSGTPLSILRQVSGIPESEKETQYSGEFEMSTNESS